MTANLLGLYASGMILLAYVMSIRKNSAVTFHLANAVLWVPVVIPSIAKGVWGAALLTTSFGLIGTWGLVKELRMG